MYDTILLQLLFTLRGINNIEYLLSNIQKPMNYHDKKTKYVQKQQPVVRFGFDFNPQLINLHTEIPQMPTKLKNKPDEGSHHRKIAELEQKKNQLKDKRLEKKREIKLENKDFLESQKDISAKIELGNKCLAVLNYDILSIEQGIAEVEEKLKRRARNLRNSQRGHLVKDTKKNYEDMSVQELDAAIEKLSIRVTTQSLNKKEETDINATIAKLQRFKGKAPQDHTHQSEDREIQDHQAAIERLKSVKRQLEQELEETKGKISAIKDDIEQFEQRAQQIQQKKKNPQAEMLKEETEKFKAKIRETREQIATLEQTFAEKNQQYEYEQTKIKWINFATETKEELSRQWQKDKAERKRKRQMEKDHPELTNTQPQRKRFTNKNQKQIDACDTLISYCRDLIPKDSSNQLTDKGAEPHVNLKEELQKGEWKSQTNVELITSKKKLPVEQAPAKNKKRKSRKHESQPQSITPGQLSHSVFIEQIFDSVKMLPPTRVDELENAIEELTDKLEIYQSQPEQNDSRGQKFQRNDRQRQKYTAEKYVKAKNQSKKINTEDFPTLQ